MLLDTHESRKIRWDQPSQDTANPSHSSLDTKPSFPLLSSSGASPPTSRQPHLEMEPPNFQPGDHISCPIGPAGLLRHHAIVIRVNTHDIAVAEYARNNQEGSSPDISGSSSLITSMGSGSGKCRFIEKTHSDLSAWKKEIGYESEGQCDSSDTVLKRAKFLLKHPQVLPKYNPFNANCECAAVWCKTGQWKTLQALTIAGHLAGVGGSVAAGATAFILCNPTVPAWGVFGVLGFTTEATALTTLAAFPAVGVIAAAGVGLVKVCELKRKQRNEKMIEENLNQKFSYWTIG
mmetsp:Transcript_24439/g.49521  ORF Transcript_24439/g.49521 Transcript_24439/m.49521 type:complete len:291 (-) Transcript_24439:50-922(-)